MSVPPCRSMLFSLEVENGIEGLWRGEKTGPAGKVGDGCLRSGQNPASNLRLTIVSFA